MREITLIHTTLEHRYKAIGWSSFKADYLYMNSLSCIPQIHVCFVFILLINTIILYLSSISAILSMSSIISCVSKVTQCEQNRSCDYLSIQRMVEILLLLLMHLFMFAMLGFVLFSTVASDRQDGCDFDGDRRGTADFAPRTLCTRIRVCFVNTVLVSLEKPKHRYNSLDCNNYFRVQVGQHIVYWYFSQLQIFPMSCYLHTSAQGVPLGSLWCSIGWLVRGVRALVFEFSSLVFSVLLYLGYAMNTRHTFLSQEYHLNSNARMPLIIFSNINTRTPTLEHRYLLLNLVTAIVYAHYSGHVRDLLHIHTKRRGTAMNQVYRILSNSYEVYSKKENTENTIQCTLSCFCGHKDSGGGGGERFRRTITIRLNLLLCLLKVVEEKQFHSRMMRMIEKYVVFERGVRECHSFMFLLCYSNYENITRITHS